MFGLFEGNQANGFGFGASANNKENEQVVDEKSRARGWFSCKVPESQSTINDEDKIKERSDGFEFGRRPRESTEETTSAEPSGFGEFVHQRRETEEQISSEPPASSGFIIHRANQSKQETSSSAQTEEKTKEPKTQEDIIPSKFRSLRF